MFEKLKNFIYKLAFIVKEIHKTGPYILFLIISSVIISGLSPVVTAHATSKLISLFEHGFQSINIDLNVIFLIIVIVLSVVINLFTDNIKYTVSETAGYKLAHNIENIIANKFQNISQQEMDNPAFLDLYKNATKQSGYAPINILYSLFGAISSLFGLIGYIIILSQLSVWFIPMLFVFIVPICYLKYLAQVKEFNFFENTTNQLRQIWYLFSLISEKQYAKEVRLFNIFNFLKTKRSRIFSNLMKERKKVVSTCIVYTAVIGVLAMISMGILEFWLVNNLSRGIIPMSKFVLYNTAVISLATGLFSFVEQFVSNNRNMLFLDYLFKFLNFNSGINSLSICKQSVPLSNSYTIEFINVSFQYYGAKYCSIKNINFKFITGEKICLVGENGSGKTTLVKLLLRIYEPSDGEILLNGKNINDYDLLDYRKLFSTTFQDFIHYFLDVKSNIALGNVDFIDDIELIKTVAQKTKADQFIEKYEKGYDTNLSKEFYGDAVELSIGQWQKLAVSRTVFRDAPILILDEPTASLDPEAEEEVFKIFNEFGKEKIVFIISHRMCSAKFADKIILLEKGEILESGTHLQLMKRKERYHALYSLQAKKYTDEDEITYEGENKI